MTATDVWISIALMFVATLATRSSFFMLGDAVKLPGWAKHALRYAPATALAATIAPDLLMMPDPSGNMALALMNPKLLAGLGAALFFVVKKHMLGTIMVGMALFTILRQVMA
ncbi:branched-subunit amino acid transport protein [Paucimonas lemoignei]|uniref:Branched-subunit amino acid transport protein n=1 Tax=Paucimonas lemoignei TaxID=29443 RepID=A0A4R3HUP0_PAULE|nr:AzlD domain-containing protein [Paucimonas lemoignei]TCS36193.1 branched-subunit amino acid transport protein [Paucimonas lemoignei]